MQLGIHFFLPSSEGFLIKWSSMKTVTGRLRGQNMIVFYLVRLFLMVIFMSNSENTLESSILTTCLNLFADLDDTLYPLSTGVATACRNNIEGN